MQLKSFTCLAALAFVRQSVALPQGTSSTTCSDSQKLAAVAAEIKTISSHSAADADAIPLNPLATRTFLVVPTELYGLEAPVNAGVTSAGVRSELVVLASALAASVPADSVHYIVNPNGTVTSDFIQLDRLALPVVSVREIHTFDDECRLMTILGYVHSNLTSLG